MSLFGPLIDSGGVISMSAWRRMALQIFPEHRRHIEDNDFTFSIYQLFFDLLPMAEEAHKAQDTDLLQRIYRYAEWCWKQKARADDVYNAVVVASYEHLVDDPGLVESIPRWLRSEIFDDLRDVFKSRMTTDEYESLVDRYDAVNHTNYR